MLFLVLFACMALTGAQATTYPANSGRVTDAAGILDAATQVELITKLKALEDKSGIQLVVATVKSLEGNAIEPYANTLFRQWKLGDAQMNNGVLLLVAVGDRKVRIEPGYGLEGTLTDAVSKIIITNAIVPRFKTGDFAGGIQRGVDDIITTLTADASEWHGKEVRKTVGFGTVVLAITPLLLFGAFFVIIYRIMRAPGKKVAGMVGARSGKYRNSSGKWVRDARSDRASGVAAGSSRSGSSSNSGSSSSSSSSDSFSGGGGSSGGGGASGDW